MRSAMIAGTGYFVPGEPVPNSFFDDKYKSELSPFLKEKRNILQRHFMSKDQATSDLVVPAALDAMKKAQVSPEEIDLVIVATDTPDYVSPSTAAVVQHKLSAKNAGVFDLNTACAGFVTALDVANKYIVADPKYKNILVVGAYGMSRYFDWDDYKVTSVFADGAGAAIVQATNETNVGILASDFYADGQYHDYMGIYEDRLLKFLKRIPVETNVIHWPRLIEKLLSEIHRTPNEIDHFFLTQLNIDTINAVLDKMELPREKSHNVMNQFGYTGSACIPMALADAEKSKKLKKGDLLFLVGSGGGMSMAAMAMRWGYDT